MKIFFCVFIFFIVAQSCTENNKITNPTGEGDENIKDIRILLLDGYNTNEKKEMSGVKVIIDSMVFFSNDSGYILIDALIEGNYNLQLSQEYYLDKDTTVYISDSSKSFNIYLSPVLNDLFPLNIGNIWIYNYYYEFTHQSSHEGTIKDGSLTYKLLRIDSLTTEIIYSFEESFSGNVSINHPYAIPPLDTTYYVQNQMREVSFTEDYNNTLHAEHSKAPFYYYELFKDGMKRYRPKYLGDSLSVENYQGYIDYEFIKDIGLNKYFSEGSTNWYSMVKLELTEFVD